MAESRHIFPVNFTGAGMDTTSAVGVQVRSPSLAGRPGDYRVLQLTLQRTAGTGTVMQPALVSSSGSGMGTVDQEWQDTSTSPVGDIYNKSFPEPGIFVRSDSDGKIYVVGGFDAGSDNEVSGKLWVESIRTGG